MKQLEVDLRKVEEEDRIDRKAQFGNKFTEFSLEIIPETIYKLIVALLGNIFQIILVSIVLDLVALMLDGAGGGDEEGADGEGAEGEEEAEGEEGAEGGEAAQDAGGAAEEGRRLGIFNGLPNITRMLRPF